MFLYFRKQIQEIADQRWLSIYGGILSLSYILTALYWINYDFAQKFSKSVETICWPFFYSCDFFRYFDSDMWIGIFISIIVMAGVVSYLFIFSKKLVWAYVGLITLEILRYFIVLVDYRARLNQHYMLSFIIFSFLFISQKQKTLSWLIVIFYFCAGVQKIDPEWFSGSGIHGRLWLISDFFISYAATYVVVLELLLIWGLVSGSSFLRRAVLVQLFTFHLISLSTIGFFYPLLMFLFLSIFLIMEFYPDVGRYSQKIPGAGFVLIGIVIFLNLWSLFVPGDKALTGEGRIIGLHMFDISTLCHADAVSNHNGTTTLRQSLLMPNVIRIRCDPVVFLSRSRKLCRDLKKDKTFSDFDLEIKSKRVGDLEFKHIVNIKDFCKTDPQYSLWGYNEWIISPQ